MTSSCYGNDVFRPLDSGIVASRKIESSYMSIEDGSLLGTGRVLLFVCMLDLFRLSENELVM